MQSLYYANPFLDKDKDVPSLAADIEESVSNFIEVAEKNNGGLQWVPKLPALLAEEVMFTLVRFWVLNFSDSDQALEGLHSLT